MEAPTTEDQKTNREYQDREKVFIDLYTIAFPPVARYIRRLDGSFEEAKDVFQEALIIFFEKDAQASPIIYKSEKAYILGIAKHLWSRKWAEKLRTTGLELAEADRAAGPDKESDPSPEKLVSFLETAGKKCMDLLQTFYYEKVSMAMLATRFGFSGERSATVQKFKCLEKVRNTIKQKSLSYEDFLD